MEINIAYSAHNLISERRIDCTRSFIVDNKFEAIIRMLAFIDAMNIQYDQHWKYQTELRIVSLNKIIKKE